MQKTDINFKRIHEIFSQYRAELDNLSSGVSGENVQRNILDIFLETLWLEKNKQTRYTAAQRLGTWKFEPLEIYLEKIGKDRKEIDEYFEKSYNLTRKFIEEKQEEMLMKIESEKLLPEFYMTLLKGHHEIWKLFSDLFLVWNRKLLFWINRELEAKFNNDSDAILTFLEENNLFDLWHHGERADRSYSILEADGDSYKILSYYEAFPEEITKIIAKIWELILQLDTLEDKTYGKKSAYIWYYQSVIEALSETECNNLVTRWAAVDTAWMDIDTPFQPAHPIEYYEDKYRKAVSIEIDFRIWNPDLFESTVGKDIEHMYEWFFDEIGREWEYKEAYEFSKTSMQQVQLHLGVPYFSYGSFLCGMYSAQVVPNDSEVSKVHGKKIFAFPSFILQSYRAAPKMKLDYETIDTELIQKHHDFLHGRDENFYKNYDISTIWHEYGHTLWLTPDTEILMNKKTGLFKCIEEFKATAGGMVAYFASGDEEKREDALVECLYRNIKMMRYREVEDVVPYYCECLISLHIFYSSGIISIEDGKINLHVTDELYTAFVSTYISVYTHLIHTYLNKCDAGAFLHEYTQKVQGYYLPREEKLREWVESYYVLYKEIGNEVV